jgi:hypothetical protein
MCFGTCPADCPLTWHVRGKGHHKPSLPSAWQQRREILWPIWRHCFYFIFYMGGGCKNVPTACAMTVRLSAHGNSRTEKSIFMIFRPNINKVTHLIKYWTTTTTTIFTWRPTNVSALNSCYRSATFQSQTAATLITHFMHKKPLNLLPYVFCSCWCKGPQVLWNGNSTT